jgi:hypothetical protein
MAAWWIDPYGFEGTEQIMNDDQPLKPVRTALGQNERLDLLLVELAASPDGFAKKPRHSGKPACRSRSGRHRISTCSRQSTPYRE